MQVALLSLDIYNDVHCSAVPALAAQHLAGEAQADAELCMRKLIANLATEVSAVGSIRSMHSVLRERKNRKVYAVRRHDGSLCTQEQAKNSVLIRVTVAALSAAWVPCFQPWPLTQALFGSIGGMHSVLSSVTVDAVKAIWVPWLQPLDLKQDFHPGCCRFLS